MTANRFSLRTMLGLTLTAITATAWAAPMTYEVDSAHTYPAFEADHMGGVSLWRGKINSTTGTVVLDKEAQTGTVELEMDLRTIDVGHQGLNDHLQTEDFFNTAQYPNATFVGELTDFVDGAPTTLDGELTMHGQTHPVSLTITRFLCKDHPMRGREVCGADATGTFDRSLWGIDYGAPLFDMGITLRVGIEALIAE
ncbi:MAG: YceI family protein [Gammaproteobacteria bacterium]|jgi:polyisoprenoid-binding protein YceI